MSLFGVKFKPLLTLLLVVVIAASLLLLAQPGQTQTSAQQVDLRVRIDKSAPPDPQVFGYKIRYNAYAEGHSPEDNLAKIDFTNTFTNAKIVDAGVSPGSGPCSINGDTVSCTDNEAKGLMWIDVCPTKPGSTIEYTATVDSDASDPNLDNNTARMTTPITNGEQPPPGEGVCPPPSDSTDGGGGSSVGSDGTSGSDHLFEQMGNRIPDNISGFGGGDIIDASDFNKDRDVLNGGAGKDRLITDDGDGQDVARCGAGKDIAIIDANDTARGCETVREK